MFKHKQAILTAIKTSSTNEAVSHRPTSGPLPWHLHNNRAIQTTLLRLRSGHNKLRCFVNKWDPFTSPNCRKGCDTPENAEHVLLQCPSYDDARTQLIRCLPVAEVTTIVGTNFNLPKHTQMKIAAKLVSYLIETKLIEVI